MAKISPFVILPPVLFAAFAAIAYFGMFRDDGDGLPSTRIGQPAPEVTDVALPGYAAIDRDVFTGGEVVVVNFWASWCPPCRAEHPTLLALQSQGVSIVGVNFKDNAQDAASYLAESGNPFVAVPLDPTGRTAIEWGVTAPPETFIVGRDGRVRHRFAGPLVGSDYEQRFLPELEKALGP